MSLKDLIKEIGKKLETAVKDLDNDLTKCIKPVGIKNVGSTCFFNAGMQLLYRIKKS